MACYGKQLDIHLLHSPSCLCEFFIIVVEEFLQSEWALTKELETLSKRRHAAMLIKVTPPHMFFFSALIHNVLMKDVFPPIEISWEKKKQKNALENSPFPPRRLQTLHRHLYFLSKKEKKRKRKQKRCSLRCHGMQRNTNYWLVASVFVFASV